VICYQVLVIVIDGILGIVVGIIGFSILFQFINALNTTAMTSIDTLILGFIPTFSLLAVLYGAFRLITSKSVK
jgi:hypothetical protein